VQTGFGQKQQKPDINLDLGQPQNRRVADRRDPAAVRNWHQEKASRAA